MADSAKPNILEVLLCPICHDSVKGTFLCPKCSQHFCQSCICTWLNSSSQTCPQCRARLTKEQLIKCPRFDELQEIIAQDHSGSFCQQHSKQQVSLFCHQCEEFICVTCYFSDSEHTYHKERIVPLEITFEYLKQKMSASLIWMQERYMEVSKTLDKAQECKDKIFELNNISERLLSSEAGVNTLREIMDTEKSVRNFRQQLDSERYDISNLDEEIYISNATKLTFRFKNFKTACNKNNTQEAIITNCGFEWRCQMKKTDKEIKYYLTLVHGKPSKCAVAIENQPEQFLNILPGKPVELEACNDTENNGNETYEFVINLRQTYKDKYQQLLVCNEQLKNEKIKNEDIIEDKSQQLQGSREQLKNKEDDMIKVCREFKKCLDYLEKQKNEKMLFRTLLYIIIPVNLGVILYWIYHKSSA